MRGRVSRPGPRRRSHRFDHSADTCRAALPPYVTGPGRRSNMSSVEITLIGGPTALIEIDGYRLLTDPTFDPPGDYQLPHVRLTKLGRPALLPEEVGPVDAVLLSHDQHADNL